MAKCFLIDGLNLIFRCFYGIPLLNTQNFPTNAIFGAVKILSKITNMEKPDHVVFFLDKGRDPIRKALHPEYKANRVEVPDPVKIQIPVVKEFAYAMGCTVIERSGVEADDLIASFAHKYRNDFDRIYILSTDKDLAQCVCPAVEQIIPGSDKETLGQYLNAQGVMEKFGVFPEQIVDYLSLIGDQADNIPGIRGVGPKTASNWLQQFENIDKILSNINQIKPERFRILLAESTELLRRNQKLIALNHSIDDIYWEKREPNGQEYDRLVDFYQLTSLKKKQNKPQWTQGDLFYP